MATQHAATFCFFLVHECFLNQVLQKQIFLCACAVSLGGCFAISCSGVNSGYDGVNEVFPILGVVGEVLSLLSFVSFSALAT